MASGQNIRAGGAYIEFMSKGGEAVQATLKELEARMQRMAKGVMMVGAALAAVGSAIVTPLLAAVRVFADMASSMLDMSQRTGMSVEALSELAYAAEQSGASVEELENGLKRMQRTIVEAAGGSDEAIKKFEALGVSVQSLQSLEPEQQFEAIAEAISNITDPAQRTAAAMDILGKGGAKLLPLMLDGARGILALREEARRLGVSMSQADAEAGEALGDKFSAAMKIAKMSVFNLGAAIAPVFIPIMNAIIETMGAVNRFINANKQMVMSAFLVGVALMAAGTAVTLFGAGVYVASFAVHLMRVAIVALTTLAWIASGAFAALKFSTYAWQIACWATQVSATFLAAVIFGLTGSMIAYDVVNKFTTGSVYAFAAGMWVASAASAGFSTSLLLPVIALGTLAAAIVLVVAKIPQIAAGLWSALQNVGNAFRGLGRELTAMFAGIGTTITSTFDGAMAMLTSGDLEGAFAIVMSGLNVLWLQTKVGFRASWAELVAGMTNIWRDMGTAMARIMIDVWGGINTVFTNAFYGVRSAWSSMVEWMATLLSKSLTEMEVLWIRTRGVFDVLPGGEARTNAAIALAREAGTAREADIAWGGEGERFDIRQERQQEQAENVRIVRERQAALATAARAGVARPADDPPLVRLRQDLADAESQLAQMGADAAELAALRGAARRGRMAGARDGTDQITSQAQNAGTFSASAASGFAGGSPMDRLQRVNEEQRDLLRTLRDLLQANGGQVPAMG